jgi:hypothetical protein
VNRLQLFESLRRLARERPRSLAEHAECQESESQHRLNSKGL